MRKLVSIISAAAIASSLMMPAVSVSAQEAQQEAMQYVLEVVKQRVEIPMECTEFSSETQMEYENTSYNFTWRNEDYSKNVSVNCTDDGIITSYYSTNEKFSDGTPFISKLSKDEAKTYAEDFIKKINPDFPYEIRLDDSGRGNLYGGGYTFNVNMYVNGTLFSDGAGTINVDGTTGTVGRFRLGYVPVEFPSLENAVSKEEAQKAYSEKLGLKLIYRTYTDDNGNNTAYPVYVQKYDYGKYINALTGDEINLNKSERNNFSMASGEAMKDEAGGSGLSEQEIKELENISGLISKENIEKQIRSNKTLDIPETISVDYIHLTKQYNKDEYRYSINMSDDETNIYVYADAKSGEILNYNRYGLKSSEKAENQNDKAFNILAGDKAKEYKFDEDRQRYVRYADGVEVENDSAEITYNEDVLTHYSISYTEAEFPSIDNAMSVSDAEKIMFDKNGYDIEYVLNVSEKKLAAVPIYVHDSVSINPFTGKFVNYRNEEITDEEDKIEYSDISGHYAEKYINELAYYGVGFEGGEFKPDEKITQKDFLSILTTVYQNGIVVAKDNKEQADYIYRTSVRNSIISEDERDDDAIVTRENASVYMIRAMGAEEYAKYNDIYVSPFNDVTENKGYIALLSAMGVVSGDGSGNFNPHREITRAESVIMIYNYLTR